jgi:hypothetical protein
LVDFPSIFSSPLYLISSRQLRILLAHISGVKLFSLCQGPSRSLLSETHFTFYFKFKSNCGFSSEAPSPRLHIKMADIQLAFYVANLITITSGSYQYDNTLTIVSQKLTSSYDKIFVIGSLIGHLFRPGFWNGPIT